MPRCYDIATRRTVDFDGIAIQIDVATIVDKVDGTLDNRILDVVTILLVAGGNPSILIREQGHAVQSDTVALGVQSQCLRTSLLLVTIAVFECQILEEDVVGIYYDGSTYADVQGIFATAELIVKDDGLIAVLSDEVQIRLLGWNVHMLLILSVLDEDKPRFGASLWGCIDSSLNGLIVARSIFSNYCIIELSLGLLTLHSSKGYLSGSNGFSATAYQYTLGHGEGIACAILQPHVLENSCFTRDDRTDLFAIECSSACAGLYLVIKGQDDATTGTNACGIIDWSRRNQCSGLVGTAL